MNKEREENLDLLRGVAAVGVCLYHCCFADSFLPHESGISKIAQHGDKGVQVFFILSGYLIPLSLYRINYKISCYGNFLLRRLLRIHPPYILALCLTCLTSVFVLKKDLGISTSSVLHNFLFTIPYVEYPWFLNVSWTLGVEIQFYLIIGLTISAFCSPNFFVRWTSLILFFGSTLANQIFFQDVNQWYLFSTWTPFFGLGIILFLYKINRVQQFEFWALIGFAFSLLFFTYPIALNFAALATLLFIMRTPKIKAHPLFHFLGKSSYSLYLIHLPVIILTSKVLSNFNFFSTSSNFTVLILLLISIVSGIAFFLLFEKPFLKISKKLRKNT